MEHPPPADLTDPDLTALRDFALGLPEAVETLPWGERAWGVRKKNFAFFWVGEQGTKLTCKLPESRYAVEHLPYVKPAGYNLGKSGWMTATIPPGEKVPVDELLDWLDESYRAVAPKTLVKALDAREA